MSREVEPRKLRLGAGLAMMNALDRPDRQVYEESLRLAARAEPLGFDSLWTVEHHFSGHSPVPNALQLLTWIAARTEQIQLGTAVIVVPWHHPLRVAEELSVLDLLSGGRVLIGLGRGAGSREYDGFQVPMAESRERFAECVGIIRQALSGGEINWAGRFHQISGVRIRPEPDPSLNRRMYGAASSPPSAEIMGRLGIGLMLSPSQDLGPAAEAMREHRAAAASAGHAPSGSMIHLYVSVGATEEEATERAIRHMRPMIEVLDRHYQFSERRLDGVPTYEHHAGPPGSRSRRAILHASLRAFLDKHLVGTPQSCAARIVEMHQRLGLEHFVGEFSYGGMSPADSDRNMTLFAEEVMPRVREAVAGAARSPRALASAPQEPA